MTNVEVLDEVGKTSGNSLPCSQRKKVTVFERGMIFGRSRPGCPVARLLREKVQGAMHKATFIPSLKLNAVQNWVFMSMEALESMWTRSLSSEKEAIERMPWPPRGSPRSIIRSLKKAHINSRSLITLWYSMLGFVVEYSVSES